MSIAFSYGTRFRNCGIRGEVAERLKAAVSKTVVLLCSTEGSNPSLSAIEPAKCGEGVNRTRDEGRAPSLRGTAPQANERALTPMNQP